MKARRFIGLFETVFILEYVKKIKSAAVRNRKTGEILACSFHWEGYELAAAHGWFPGLTDPDAWGALEDYLEQHGQDTLNVVIEDGFIDLDGNFLNRQEALAVARQAQQLSPSFRPSKQHLNSEDL